MQGTNAHAIMKAAPAGAAPAASRQQPWTRQWFWFAPSAHALLHSVVARAAPVVSTFSVQLSQTSLAWYAHTHPCLQN